MFSEIEDFRKGLRNQRFSKKPTKSKIFQNSVDNILSRLIHSVESFEIFLWVNWVGPDLLSNMIELIDILKLYRFMVIESIHFHTLPRLNWLLWQSRIQCTLHAAYASCLAPPSPISQISLQSTFIKNINPSVKTAWKSDPWFWSYKLFKSIIWLAERSAAHTRVCPF